MNTPTADRFAWQGHYDQRMAAAWERDGYLVLDGFVSPEDVARMRARADSLIKDFDIEAHRVVFSAKGQSHAASDYFMKSAANISFFLEEEAVDEDGRLLKDKGRAINKIGHALHDLDPVFADISHNADFEALSRGIGMADPLLLQSMVICKQPYIGGEVNTHQDSTFIYTEPETCTGFWLALEDAIIENGCMWAAPGGHKGGLRHRFMRDGDGMKMITLEEGA
ncbi:MAG: phytanoyl-CoA dioxygenase family protein, partial [Pseudomonadota bacterium]|nr:phytanoyl-CoA dioxygenase family protein [Pseudomonadota bacterium]